MKKYLIIVSLTFISQCVIGQFLPEFSQQIKMYEFINPGYNASKEEASGVSIYSNNYTNVRGYNGLWATNISLPVNKWHTSFGATVINEMVGNYERFNGSFNACVDVKILKSTHLDFGIGLGLESGNDSFSEQNFSGKKSFYSSSGLNLFSKNLYLGIAVHCTQLANNNYFNNENYTYIIAGNYNFELYESPSIKPVFMYKYHSGISYFETGILMNFSKIFETGLSYRFNKSIIYFAELRLFKITNLGYSYQYNFSNDTYFTDGLHEFSFTLRMAGRQTKGEKIISIVKG